MPVAGPCLAPEACSGGSIPSPWSDAERTRADCFPMSGAATDGADGKERGRRQNGSVRAGLDAVGAL